MRPATAELALLLGSALLIASTIYAVIISVSHPAKISAVEQPKYQSIP